MNITDKITIIKNDKRKMINSSIKKEEYRCEIISIEDYAQRLTKTKADLSSTHLKLEK